MPRFAIYRILGNDLPPRHDEGQTLRNVGFILDHEPHLEDSRRFWILNSILDYSTETALLRILQQRDEEVIHIPFDPGAYRAVLQTDHARRLLTLLPLNRARNIALEYGAAVADWILPLDGNCIFDPEGWHALQMAIKHSRREMHALPMIRLDDNPQFFTAEKASLKPTEPQLCIAAASSLRFNESLAYGKDSKVELIKRYFPQTAIRIDAFGTTVEDARYQAGIVYRLASGTANDGTAAERQRLRDTALGRLFAKAASICAEEYDTPTPKPEAEERRRSP